MPRFTFSLVLVLVCGILTVPGLVRATPATEEPVAGSLNIFQNGAASAIAVDLTTGIALYSYDADVQLPPASTIKVVTAVVAKRLLPLGQVVVIEDADVLDAEEYSVMGLMAGDAVTVEALLYGLLMPSGGDAALALARAGGRALDPEAADPVQRFVAEMNAYAASIGMSNTHISNPIGADEPGLQYSTARDLVRATQVLLDDWLLAKIVNTTAVFVPIGGAQARSLEVHTTNQLLERDDIFGIKTGTDDAAGQCFIAGVWRGDNQIITVVLGSTDRYADTQALLDEVDGRFRWVALGVGARSVGALEGMAMLGYEFRIRRTVIMTVEQAESMTWSLLDNPGGAGSHAGVVQFTTGGREVARIPVY